MVAHALSEMVARGPAAFAGADAAQLAKILTCAVRGDRFCEGALAANYDSGLLARIAAKRGS